MKFPGSIVWLWVLAGLIVVAGCSTAPISEHPTANAAQMTNARPVKVLIITLFKPEAEAWSSLEFTSDISIPGLSRDYPTVRCNADDVCLVTTGMGHANAAASILAVVLSGKLDLRSTYFLISGIAGIDPNRGTIGSAAWARFLVDYGIAHEIDAREMPQEWPSGYFGIGASGPEAMPRLEYRNEVFHLNEDLLQRALKLSAGVTLKDNAQAAAYRSLYPQAAAKSPPSVIQCDTAAGDTYWHGEILGQRAAQWTSVLTQGEGHYCTTQQEENAVYEALRRGSDAGLLDLNRVADLRTAANFDRQHPGQTAIASLASNSGGFSIAIANLSVAGMPLVRDIVDHWNVWQTGVPK